MSGAFDVDCPRTPDEADGGNAPPSSRRQQAAASRPPSPPQSRPPRLASRSRSSGVAPRARLASFSPRLGRARKRAGGVGGGDAGGLEPEEYVAPPPGHRRVSSTRPDPTSRQASREGPGTSAPEAAARTHSTEAFGGPPAGAAAAGKGGSTNPFDTPDMAGAAGRKRTNSGSFWGREIVQEGADKGEFSLKGA